MWINIPSLQEALAESELREFRQRRGKRYELQSLLLLSCIAMMNGARTEGEIAEWVGSNGERWLKWLGVRGGRRPSAATISRLFRGIDGARLEAALILWGAQVLDSLRLTGEEEELEAESGEPSGGVVGWRNGTELIGGMGHRLNGILDCLYGRSDWERASARRDSLLAGLVLTGYVEADELGARLPLHGPMIDMEEERDRSLPGGHSDRIPPVDPFPPAPCRRETNTPWARMRA
ncbi:MAG: transposase family protein [Blastocatellia bacterium]